ncbi:MAG: LacI family DNA-binding transcriptional regulator [Gracilimonas sp.]
MKVTLKDIAQESGYSISTVSRVLNGSGNISKEVQMQIVKIAEKLDYPFVKSKIPIYSNGTLHIALVIDFRVGEFYSSFFYGFSEAAREADIQLSLIDVVDHEENLVNTINNLNEQIIDGICLFLPEMELVDYKNLLKEINTKVPIVSNSMTQTPVLPTITFDGLSGGHLAADYFIKKGYKSFGIVKGPYEKAEARFRYNGFKDNLRHLGYDLIMEAEGNFMFQSGVDAFYSFHKLENKPEAIFVSNDHMLKGFMETAKHHGYKIPDDVALIGYDNTPMCEESYPKITTINTDFKALGIETFKVLKDIISKKHSRNGTLNLVPVTLVERETA